jgi:hypothetical protein
MWQEEGCWWFALGLELMVRNSKPPSLYEIIKGSRPKGRSDKGLRRPRLFRRGEKQLRPSAEAEEKPLNWPRRPRMLQFNAGRVEISMPYEYAVAFVLGIVLVSLLAYRIGQWEGQGQQTGPIEPVDAPGRSENVSLPPVDTAGITRIPESEAQKETGHIEKVKMVEPLADHRIVIQQYQVYADLVPVQRHFIAYGIETEIEQRGDWYFLVTLDRFENPEKPGTVGYAVKRRIVEVGAKYRAPRGYETFAPAFFSDAYGERVK